MIGVLALQGAFSKHMEMLKALQVKAKEVRRPEELAECDALIIPGGESTVISRQMHFIQFEEPFEDFAKKKPVFGTCAGLILMSKEVVDGSVKPFGILNIIVERNAFGRQHESFEADINVNIGKAHRVHALFIRAPRIKSCSSDVQILASLNEEPVLVQQGHHLAATFHPELSADTAIHRHFLKLVHAAK